MDKSLVFLLVCFVFWSVDSFVHVLQDSVHLLLSQCGG